jgi:hypothetical protein
LARLCVLLLVLLAGLPAHSAKAVTFPEQAERLQLIYGFLLDFRPVQGPLIVERPELELEIDLTAVPSIDNRVGGKEEPVEPPALIPRPRLRYHSGGGWMVGASYTPSARVSGYQAALAAVEAQYRAAAGVLRFGLRVFATDGEVEGPVTDPAQDDLFELTNRGGDLLIGARLGAWLPYLGGGGGNSESMLTIRSDGVQLEVDTSYTYALAGITLDGGGFRITLEQYRTESYLDNFTLGLSLAF